jgi:hypothetical protein
LGDHEHPRAAVILRGFLARTLNSLDEIKGSFPSKGQGRYWRESDSVPFVIKSVQLAEHLYEPVIEVPLTVAVPLATRSHEGPKVEQLPGTFHVNVNVEPVSEPETLARVGKMSPDFWMMI